MAGVMAMRLVPLAIWTAGCSAAQLSPRPRPCVDGALLYHGVQEFINKCYEYCVPEGKCTAHVDAAHMHRLGIRAKGSCAAHGYPEPADFGEISSTLKDYIQSLQGTCAGIRLTGKFLRPRGTPDAQPPNDDEPAHGNPAPSTPPELERPTPRMPERLPARKKPTPSTPPWLESPTPRMPGQPPARKPLTPPELERPTPRMPGQLPARKPPTPPEFESPTPRMPGQLPARKPPTPPEFGSPTPRMPEQLPAHKPSTPPWFRGPTPSTPPEFESPTPRMPEQPPARPIWQDRPHVCSSGKLPYKIFSPSTPNICTVACVPEGACQEEADKGSFSYVGIGERGDCKGMGFNEVSHTGTDIKGYLHGVSGECNAKITFHKFEKPAAEMPTTKPGAKRLCGPSQTPYVAIRKNTPGTCSVYCIPNGDCKGQVQWGRMSHFSIIKEGTCDTEGYTAMMPHQKETEWLDGIKGPCAGMTVVNFQRPP